MSKAAQTLRRAVTAHREAAGLLSAVRDRLSRIERQARGPAAGDVDAVTEVVHALRVTAATLAPGWFGITWAEAASARLPLGSLHDAPAAALRIGTGSVTPDLSFPALVPFAGAGHLAVDVDARDARVAGLVLGVLVRLLAGLPPGAVRVLAVDGAALGAPFAPLRALVGSDLMTDVATDLAGLREALTEAEAQVVMHQRDPANAPAVGDEGAPATLVLAIAGLPPGTGRQEYARLAALAHAGADARVHLVVAGYPPRAGVDVPLGDAAVLSRQGAGFVLTAPTRPELNETADVAGARFSVAVDLDPAPPEGLVTELCRYLSERARVDSAVSFNDLVPPELWQESSVDGLRTVVGRAGRTPVELTLDDATPHWLIGGRTGSGKTVLLLDVLYGLAARYSPDELALYLLDFKEGVSFTEFTPTPVDPSWVPHARTVGIESDREYGVAVLTDLTREMQRRAVALKKAGATRLSQLRSARPDVALPRIVCVIDEFHVLLQGGDTTAARATALLEEVARKGRSYGIHLVLASQTTSGIESLFSKGDSIFGQFPLRIALAGGGGVLASPHLGADGLTLGTAVINDAAGAPGADRRVRFPDAASEPVAALRHRLWAERTPGSHPPAVFAGFAEYAVEDDPTFARLTPAVRRRTALLGRAVDVGLPTATFSLDAAPGRHLAVLGTSPVGADVLHAATLSLSRQHAPGQASFQLAGLVAAADPVVDALAATLGESGHQVDVLDVDGLRTTLRGLTATGSTASADQATYVVVFGADAASAALRLPYEGSRQTPLDDLRSLLHEGPARGVHVIGWWRVIARLAEDLGSGGREDVAGLLALNVRAAELGPLIGRYDLEWTPRLGRGLLIDRHDDTSTLVVPFVRPGRYTDHSLPIDRRERP